MSLLPVVYILAMAQAAFLIPVLWLKSSNRTANRTLMIILAVMGVACGHALYLHTRTYLSVPAFLFLVDPLDALYGPLFYFYTRAMLQRPVAWRAVLPHLVPFAIFVALAAPRIVMSPADKLATFISEAATNTPFVIRLCQALAQIQGFLYLVLCLVLVWRYRRRIAPDFSNVDRIHLRWLQGLLLVLLVLWLASGEFEAAVQVGIAAVIYAVAYFSMWQPQLSIAPSLVVVPPPPPEPEPERKYAKTRLRDDHAQQIEERLTSLFATEKPYLDPELTSQSLADRLGVTTHQLSQVLNDRCGKTFYDYVNLARVREVERRLVDPAFGNEKITTIGLECGFSSKSTMNLNFKKHTGLTPSQYRARHAAA